MGVRFFARCNDVIACKYHFKSTNWGNDGAAPPHSFSISDSPFMPLVSSSTYPLLLLFAGNFDNYFTLVGCMLRNNFVSLKGPQKSCSAFCCNFHLNEDLHKQLITAEILQICCNRPKDLILISQKIYKV